MRYFGTDGIRGRADALLSADIPYLLGRALAGVCGRIVVARDVRESSPTIERSLVRGLLTGDAQISLAGELPTPALAYIAQTLDARFAVMITASHNPPQFNGLKVFSRRGQKLSPREEEALDSALCALADNADPSLETREALASDESCPSERDIPHRVRVLRDAERQYIEHIAGMFPRFDGVSVTLDAAHGCMAGTARRAFEALGASVRAINDDRDGARVNVGCGSTHIEALLEATPQGGIGFAFDGDGDRVIAVTDSSVYDGDAILLALATMYRARGKLKKKLVVGTELSNGRLQRELAAQNIALLRTPVGDKHVLEALSQNGCPLGGEKSGHILMSDRASTGDGLVTALSLLEAKQTMGRLPSFEPFPMIELDLPSEDPARELESDELQAKLRQARAELGSSGRFVARASGTEPLIRLTIECCAPNAEDVFAAIKEIFDIAK